MVEHNTPWLVDVETKRHWGLCDFDRDVDTSSNKPYAFCTYPDSSDRDEYRFIFSWRRDLGQQYESGTVYEMDLEDSILTWTRQTYDLPGNTDITIDKGVIAGRHGFDVGTNRVQERFETEAEAIEFAESQRPTPIITFNDGDYLLRASFRQEISGVWINRTVGLQHVGDPFEINTITDLENYYASAMGIDTPFVIYGLSGTDRDAVEGGLGCGQYLDITILNVDTHVSSTITVEPDFQSLPDSPSITIIDGDPVVSATMLENGPGSVTVSDNGNTLMLNDGGTFFLNEFGNVGFFANGDASLTANNQVQLGVGQNSVTVENGSLTIRDETGSATLTAEDINRLKETLT